MGLTSRWFGSPRISWGGHAGSSVLIFLPLTHFNTTTTNLKEDFENPDSVGASEFESVRMLLCEVLTAAFE